MDPYIRSQEIYEGDWSAVRPGLFVIRYLLGSGLYGFLSGYENHGDKQILGYRQMKTVSKFLSLLPRGPPRRAYCHSGVAILGAIFETIAIER